MHSPEAHAIFQENLSHILSPDNVTTDPDQSLED